MADFLQQIQKLKTHIPDSVLGEIPLIASKFEINTILRLSHFLGQCSEESGKFTKTSENLNYSAERLLQIWPKHFTAIIAKKYAHSPQTLGAYIYANKLGNGDEASKEGWAYRGRGYIQLTGKVNYSAFAAVIDPTIIANPDLVSTKYPLASAAWFFQKNHLNTIADTGMTTDVLTHITKIVNGGILGLSDRIIYANNFYKLLSV
jgi:putative chitinase